VSRTAIRTAPRVTVPVTLVVLVAFLLALVPNGPAVAADAGLEAQFVSALNRERTAAGLAPLKVSPELTRVARQHSRRMVSQQRLHHNPDLARSVRTWRKLGENVGRGGKVDTIHRAFLRSPSHRRNLLDRDWREVGIGVEVRGGVVWVTQVYRAP
jgi:uncharacterized protein YkwD